MLVPEATKAMDVQKQLNKALRKTYASDGEKVRQIQQLLMKYLYHFKNLRGRAMKLKPSSPQSIYQTAIEETNEPANENQQNVPTEQEVNDMVAAITRRPDIMDINMRGELVYRGLDVPGSNILDLMSGVGADQELFEAGMREVQEAERTLGSVADFDGFSFYNEWNPQYASTPRSTSPIVEPRTITDQQTSHGSLSNNARHKMSLRRQTPLPEANEAENGGISDDELPDPTPLRPSHAPLRDNDPRNSVVKTKRVMLKRRRQTQAKTHQMKKREKNLETKRRIKAAAKTTLLGKRHTAQPIPAPGKYRHLDQEQILSQKRFRDLSNRLRAKRRVSKVVKKVQDSRKQQNARKERVAEIISKIKRTVLKRPSGEEIRRIGPMRKKSRTGQSEQDEARLARKRVINIDIKRRGPAKKYMKQEDSMDKSESNANKKFATLLQKARTQRIATENRRTQTKKTKWRKSS